MATLKLYNPILSEATKECYWFCDEAGTSFKDVDEFINGIPAGDDNIELLLHCDGGEVNEGWAIVDKLRSTGKKITATIEGNCASMATVVLLAASERRAYPHASLLIHKPYYPEYTLADAYRADDLESLAASLRDDEQKMLDFYVERTGADRAELEALMNEDKFIGMERAKELGFIQTIIPAASASAGGPNSAKSAAWKQQNSITNNQNSMATKTTKSEDKSVLRKALAALAVALGLEAPQPVNYELNTESGDTITIDKPDGEDPAVGDSASSGILCYPSGDALSPTENTRCPTARQSSSKTVKSRKSATPKTRATEGAMVATAAETTPIPMRWRRLTHVSPNSKPNLRTPARTQKRPTRNAS